jgi:hypothetical protein
LRECARCGAAPHTPTELHMTDGSAFMRSHCTAAGARPMTMSRHCRGKQHMPIEQYDHKWRVCCHTKWDPVGQGSMQVVAQLAVFEESTPTQSACTSFPGQYCSGTATTQDTGHVEGGIDTAAYDCSHLLLVAHLRAHVVIHPLDLHTQTGCETRLQWVPGCRAAVVHAHAAACPACVRYPIGVSTEMLA